MIRRALFSTLFPYTTLFRSRRKWSRLVLVAAQSFPALVERPWPRTNRKLRRWSRARRYCVPRERRRRRENFPDRKSTRLNSSHLVISYAVFCLKKKNKI